MRKYVGFDGYATKKRAGTEQFIREFVKATGGAFFNNGSYGRRAIRGGSKPSIHGTGRAVDLSYRGAPHSGCGDRKVAEKWINWLADNGDRLMLTMVVDYQPKPFGRAWRCDRGWKKYLVKTVTGGGASWADWIHVEVDPSVADDADFFKQAFAELKGADTTPPKRNFVPFRGKPIRRGEKDKALVMKIQKVVGAKVDGIFGRKTEAALMRWQGKHGLQADGWIGSQTWPVISKFFD